MNNLNKDKLVIIYSHPNWNYFKLIYNLHFENIYISNSIKKDIDKDYYFYIKSVDKTYFKILLNDKNIINHYTKYNLQSVWTIFKKNCKQNKFNTFNFSSFNLNKWKNVKNLQKFTNSIDLYKNYKTSLELISKRSENEEENLEFEDNKNSSAYLYSYDKNIIRMMYVFLKGGLFFQQLAQYLELLVEKLDGETRNTFYSKFKDWMDFYLFIKPPKSWNKFKMDLMDYIDNLEKQDLLLGDLNEDFLFLENVASDNIANQIENIILEYFKKQIEEEKELEREEIEEERKQKLAPLSFYMPIYYLLKKIHFISQFFDITKLSKRTKIDLRESYSIFYVCIEDQLNSDILSILKILQITESWINDMKENDEKLVNDIYSFVKLLRNTMKMIDILTIQQNLKYQTHQNQLIKFISEVYHHPSENLDLYTNWMNRNIKSLILLSIQNNNVLEDYFDFKNNTKSQISIDWINQRFPISIMIKNKNLERMRHLFFDNMYFFIYGKKKTLKNIYEISKILRSIKVTIGLDHVRLVMSIAKNINYSNVELLDLLQEGMLGVLKAVERFQVDRGYQFTTYATWWIQQGLNRIIATHGDNMIPLPTHLQRKIHLIQTTSRMLGKKYGREPIIDEVASELNIPIYKIYQFLESSTYLKKVISVDQRIFTTDTRTYYYFLNKIDNRVPVNATKLYSYLMKFIPIKEATIMKMKLGIIPFEKHNMEQIMRIFGINRDKIKLIERKSNLKIRHCLSFYGKFHEIAPYISNHLSERLLGVVE